jgi:hypothetical protein
LISGVRSWRGICWKKSVAGFGPRKSVRPERTYADETPLATSYRVYTPAEIRTSRPRPTLIAAPPPKPSVTPEIVVKGVAVGMAAVLGVFAAFFVIGNLTDDAGRRAIPTANAIHAPPPAPIVPPVEVAAAAPLQIIGDPPTDFEIPDDAPPARSAAKAKGKQNKRRIIRTLP